LSGRLNGGTALITGASKGLGKASIPLARWGRVEEIGHRNS